MPRRILVSTVGKMPKIYALLFEIRAFFVSYSAKCER
ncbi:Uncharacterised protein [Salmonella enterica subsp. enterica]|uniref:Uncharacterized protein n=1 Tax=Salmonella enterica I TaxID=59201 RepID=A0A379VYT6_SALET|nr:Uncharacterised protein [Salmonella enterica subsp. enterica]